MSNTVIHACKNLQFFGKTDRMSCSKLQHIGNTVQIETNTGHTFTGCVYTIDPISNSYILLTEDNGIFKVNYINGIFIRIVTPLGESDLSEIEPFPVKERHSRSKDGMEDLKSRVKDWLHSHRIKVTEDGLCLKLFDSVTINPPYQPSDCCSANIIVLEKVQNLMATFPCG